MSSVPAYIQERRIQRSEETYRAICYQLEHVVKLHGLRNFTLSGFNGLVLASAGHREEAEVLAAYSPVLARCVDRHSRKDALGQISDVLPIDPQHEVSVRSFFVDGERFYLSVVGRAGTLLDTSVYRALTGIRRIFKQTIN